MPAVRRNAVTELVWKAHGWLYRVSGGRLLGRTMGLPVLLLTTTGRRSGRPRTTPLMYLPRGEACVVIASNAGEPRHPAWWLNLEADPRAAIQRGARETRVRAREAEGGEREEIWRELVSRQGVYDTYASWTRRKIPVVVLEPEAEAATGSA